MTKHFARLGGVNVSREGVFMFDTEVEALAVATDCKASLVAGEGQRS